MLAFAIALIGLVAPPAEAATTPCSVTPGAVNKVGTFVQDQDP